MCDTLLTNDVLDFLYQEVKDEKFVCSSLDFWRHVLIQHFPADEGYLVNMQMPLEPPRLAVSDMTVGHIRHGRQEPLVIVKAIRPGDGGKPLVQEAHDDLRKAAASFFQLYQSESTVFGLTVQGTAALPWKFSRGLRGTATVSPIFNSDCEDDGLEYVDADAIASIGTIKDFLSHVQSVSIAGDDM